MKVDSLFRVLCALQYAYMVESPYRQRGGVLLIASPGNMKSTFVEKVCDPFSNALKYSDLTLKQLAVVRTSISNGIYQTLGFLELEKIYARNPMVAMNLEGVLKAMVEEGFSHFAFEDKRCWVPTARCYVIASVLDSLYRFHFPRWQENGFLRRFLQFKYSLSQKSREKVNDAQHRGEIIELPPMFPIATTAIPYNITEEESRKLAVIIGSEEMVYTSLNLLRKALCVLKWVDKQEKRSKKKPTPMEYIEDLKDGFGPFGGQLEL